MNSINSKNKIHRIFLVVVVCFGIFYEISCHAQFHRAKIGRQETTLLKKAIQDFVKDADELDFKYKVSYELIELNQR